MLSRKEKAELREEIFRHLDGIAIAPTAFCLHQQGVIEYLLQVERASLSSLTSKFQANEGYLNVALRLLSSQGWIDMHLEKEQDDIIWRVNQKSEIISKYVHLYQDVTNLLKYSENFHPRKFELAPFQELKKIFARYRSRYDIKEAEEKNENEIQRQVLKHIEGILVGPTIVQLGMSGMFHKYFMEASFRPEEFHQDPVSFRELLNFLSSLGWFTEKNGTYRFTEKGLFFAKRASAYGVTVSYIPMFRHLEDLIFGNPDILRNVNPGEKEKHVDREMNVWGSGGAHATYFKKIDEIIIDIFNKPIEDQPKGILDMGCGNGAFLKHIYEVIEQRTLRGSKLEDYPLFLIGADFNEAAIKVTRANLIQADIWAKVIHGDIGRPDLLAKDLKEDYGIELKELLNVRTFLDHNRIWSSPLQTDPKRLSLSTGAFAHRGVRIPNNLVEDNLLEHFKKWEPYVGEFGLLVIELHTIDPKITAANLGKTAATAYDATHGFSDQFIVELDVFIKVAQESGLFSDPTYFCKFPDSELATVSIHLLKRNIS